MTLQIDALELVWIVMNAVNLVVTTGALLDARRDRAAVLAGNGNAKVRAARGLVAAGNFRREAWRLVAQLLLLTLVIPGLFSDRPAELSPFLLALMGVSAALLVNTLADRRERIRLARVVQDEIVAERVVLARESSVQQNIGLTKQGIDEAKTAGVKAEAAVAKVNERLDNLADVVHGPES